MITPALPALISRPAVDAPALPGPAVPDSGPAAFRPVRQDLTAGLPARIDLDGGRGLVLAVPLGVARAVLSTDPQAVVFDTGEPSAPATDRDTGAAWPRLTLLAGGAIGETVPVVAGVPCPLRLGSSAVVEVTVDRLVITIGTLRSPGQFGSRVALRWRDLGPAPDTGPPPSTGDPGVPVLHTASRTRTGPEGRQR